MRKYSLAIWLRCLLFIWAATVSFSISAQANPVTILRAKYITLERQLRQNQFKRPLVLDSAETPNQLSGNIYAVVDYPFRTVSAGLNNPANWCDVMILHINTKYCHPMMEPPGTVLRVYIGKKTPEELTDTERLDFNYRIVAATPDYLQIMLNAKTGPLGTSDYRIVLEATALPNAKTFLHLTYSYAMNFAGRLAVQTYLGTIGSGKVGFTVIGKRADGQPDYIGGVRGLVERNTMRYYLAIDSFLAAASAAPNEQLEKRLQNWFTATEQYSRQLHEMNRGEYLAMKRAEYLRQQTVQ